MAERRRHNYQNDQDTINPKFDGQLYGTRGLQLTKRRDSSGYTKPKLVLPVATSFRYHRARTGVIFLIMVATLTLLYLGFQIAGVYLSSNQKLHLDVDNHILTDIERNIALSHDEAREKAQQVATHETRGTSAKTSGYQILNPPIHGGYLHIHIQARDQEGHPRTTGGDFWFATLSAPGSESPPQPEASTAGKIIDHKNGTYSVYFYLGWVGKTEVNITLNHSNDAIKFLRNIYWNTEGKTVWNGHFDGEFVQKGSHVKEQVSECTIRRNGPRKEECEFWFPQAMGQTVFVCHKPENNSRCSSMRRITHNFDASTRVTREIAGIAFDMFKGFKFATRLSNGVKAIDVLHGNNATLALTTQIVTSRPLCKPIHVSKMKPDSRRSSGFWYNGNWTSLVCTASHWRDTDKIGNCLRNRELTLSGDSTSRQWATYLMSTLKGIPIPPFGRDFFKAHRYIPAYNFSLNFVFHPQVQTGNSYTFNDVIHTVQLLEDMRNKIGCGNDIVVISPWAHFLQWTRESYQEKLILIRKTVDKYLYKCPNNPVVIKGPHARHARTFEERVFGSNYTAFEWGEVMRSTFAGSGAWFLDVWDMNLSFPSKIDVHMPIAVIRQEIDMFLSYVCQSQP